MEQEISRRKFLVGAGLASIAAGMGLAGCSPGRKPNRAEAAYRAEAFPNHGTRNATCSYSAQAVRVAQRP